MFVDFPTTVKYNAKKDPTIAVLDENAFYLNSYKTIKEAADSLGVKVSIIRQSLNYNKSIQDITSLLPTLAQWGKLAFLVDYKQAKDNGWLVEQEEYIDEDSCIQE
jgi:hypothetical protein